MRARQGYKKQPIPLEWGARSGADFATLRQRRDAVSGAEGQRFDGHGWLSTAGSHQAAAIAKEKIFDVMRAVVRIDNRRLRIFPHPAGAEKMNCEIVFLDRIVPLFLCPGGVENLEGAVLLPLGQLEIVGLGLVVLAPARQAPGMLEYRVRGEACGP